MLNVMTFNVYVNHLVFNESALYYITVTELVLTIYMISAIQPKNTFNKIRDFRIREHEELTHVSMFRFRS